MKKILYILIGAAMLAGCSKELADEPKTTAKPGEQVMVTFGASVSGEASQMSAMQGADTPASRAASPITTQYTGYIGVIDSDGNWVAGSESIKLAIENVTGAVTTDPKQVVLTAESKYTFRSVAVPGGMPPIVSNDKYDLAFGKTTPDLIYGEVKDKTIYGGDKITFNYNHLHGKVKFVLEKGDYITDEQLAEATLTVSGYYVSGTFDLQTGRVAPGAAGSNVSVEKNTEYFALPQTFTTGSEATATVTVDGETYSGKITEGNITADQLTTVTITVNIEEPAPIPKTGDYYYSDGSFSTTFKTDSPLLGVVYHANSKKGMLVEVTESKVEWGDVEITNATHTTDGQANMATIKALDPGYSNYPAFKHCANKNAGGATDWYLPALEELRVLDMQFNSYDRTAFNTRLTAAGVNGTEIQAGNYWSSSESDSNSEKSWYINLYSSVNSDGEVHKTNQNRVRCVRAFSVGRSAL